MKINAMVLFLVTLGFREASGAPPLKADQIQMAPQSSTTIPLGKDGLWNFTSDLPYWRAANGVDTSLAPEGLACVTPIPVPAWTALSPIILGERRLNSGNTYQATHAGTTGNAGGPTGSGSSITDGSVTWKFMGAGIVAVAATGNGATDDTMGFQAWAAQLIVQNQSLGTIPAGTYKITSPGVDFSCGAAGPLSQNTVIRGAGPRWSIIAPAPDNGTTFYVFNFIFNGYDDQAELRDLSIYGTTGVTVDTGGLINTDGSITVRNMRVSNISCGLPQCFIGGGVYEHVKVFGTGGGQKVSEFELFNINTSAIFRDFEIWDIDEVNGGGAFGKVGNFPGGNLPSAALYVTANAAATTVVFQDGLIDETIGYQGIRVSPASGGRIPQVVVTRVAANVGSGLIAGANYYNEPRAFIRAINVDKLVVSESTTRFNVITNNYSVWATGTAATEVQNLVMSPQGPQRFQFDAGCTSAEVIESDYALSALDSAATSTRVLKNGVWAFLTTNPSGDGTDQLDAAYPAWQATHGYLVADRVTNGGNVYQCAVAGTSAGAGGPTGADGQNTVLDGTVRWIFINSAATQYVRVKELPGNQHTSTGLSGDGSFASPILLTNTAITPGTYGDSTHVGACTYDQQGRATGCSSVSIANISGGPFLPLGGGTMTGNISLANSATAITTASSAIKMKSGAGGAPGYVFDTVNGFGASSEIVQWVNGGTEYASFKSPADNGLRIDAPNGAVQAYSVNADGMQLGVTVGEVGMYIGGTGVTCAAQATNFRAPLFKTTTALVALGGNTTPAIICPNCIGSAGQPTTATQNAWLKMQDSTGATIWIPVWK